MKYEILGEPMPVVVCNLEKDESMITEKGSMVWMTPNMQMQTGAGGVGKAFGRMSPANLYSRILIRHGRGKG